jgi:hypothetical protein
MVPNEISNDLAATGVTKFDELDPRQLEAYWALVKRCLKEIFGKTEQEVEASFQDLRSRFESIPREDWLFFYHNSPLQVAANLAGASSRPLSPDEKVKYVKIISENRHDQPDEGDIRKIYPDDLPFH